MPYYLFGFLPKRFTLWHCKTSLVKSTVLISTISLPRCTLNLNILVLGAVKVYIQKKWNVANLNFWEKITSFVAYLWSFNLCIYWIISLIKNGLLLSQIVGIRCINNSYYTLIISTSDQSPKLLEIQRA